MWESGFDVELTDFPEEHTRSRKVKTPRSSQIFPAAAIPPPPGCAVPPSTHLFVQFELLLAIAEHILDEVL